LKIVRISGAGSGFAGAAVYSGLLLNVLQSGFVAYSTTVPEDRFSPAKLPFRKQVPPRAAGARIALSALVTTVLFAIEEDGLAGLFITIVQEGPFGENVVGLRRALHSVTSGATGIRCQIVGAVVLAPVFARDSRPGETALSVLWLELARGDVAANPRITLDRDTLIPIHGVAQTFLVLKALIHQLILCPMEGKLSLPVHGTIGSVAKAAWIGIALFDYVVFATIFGL